jgi:hypothetical protein
MTLSARLSKLERQQPACPCRASAALVRLRDEDEPPAPSLCEKCGRPEPRTVVREVIVTKTADGLQFVAPDWCRFLSPSEATALVADADEDRWQQAEQKARARRAAGLAAYYFRQGRGLRDVDRP